MDRFTEFNNFIKEYDINAAGKYDQITLRTVIIYRCSECNKECKK